MAFIKYGNLLPNIELRHLGSLIMSRLVLSKSPGHGLFMHTKSESPSKPVSKAPSTPLSEAFATDSLLKQVKMLESKTSQLSKLLAFESSQRQKFEAEVTLLRASEDSLTTQKEAAFEAVDLLNARIVWLETELVHLQSQNAEISTLKDQRASLAARAEDAETALATESRRSRLLAAELTRSEDERRGLRDDLRTLTDKYELETSENFRLKQLLAENVQTQVSARSSRPPTYVRKLSRQELDRLDEIQDIRNLN